MDAGLLRPQNLLAARERKAHRLRTKIKDQSVGDVDFVDSCLAVLTVGMVAGVVVLQKEAAVVYSNQRVILTDGKGRFGFSGEEDVSFVRVGREMPTPFSGMSHTEKRLTRFIVAGSS